MNGTGIVYVGPKFTGGAVGGRGAGFAGEGLLALGLALAAVVMGL